MSRGLTLIAPALLQAPVEAPAGELVRLLDGVELAATEWLLARAVFTQSGDPAGPARDPAWAAFGFAPGTEPPPAALARFGDGAAADPGVWLRLEPVHLQADLHTVHMIHGAALDLRDDEMGELFSAVAAALAAHGIALDAPAARRWYVDASRHPDLRACSPAGIGAGAEHLLPTGADAGYWQQLATEGAMAIHDSAANLRRARRGVPEINALWPWGAGRLPAPPTCDWRRVWSDRPLARGLARLAGVAVEGDAESPEVTLEAAAHGAALACCGAVAECVEAADVDGWRRALAALEADWLAPALARIGDGRLPSLTIDCATHVLRVDRRARWRWWRRRRSFAVVLEAFAGSRKER